MNLSHNQMKIFVIFIISITSNSIKMGIPQIKNYYFIEKISKGAFGEVWKAISNDSYNTNNNTNKGVEIAIKIEKKERKSHLRNEYAMLSYINPRLHITPSVFHLGETPTFNYMVIELLGKSIDKYYYHNTYNNILKSPCNKSSTLKYIGIQMLHCIQYIHKHGIIHRDIKPQNFLFSIDNKRVYIIDFGVSTLYIDNKKQHKPMTYHNSRVGTIDFISYYLHEGLSASRRDDLISMIYVIIYMYNEMLPWQKENRLKSIYEMKYNISPSDLCNSLSDKINVMLVYCYSLEYTAEPNYEYIRFLFETM